MIFRFPRTRFVNFMTLRDQLHHSTSEMLEAVTALDCGEGVIRTVEEMLDCIHSLESGLRIAAEQHGINIAEIAAQVQLKNRSRGYYLD